jgi:xanthine dehydrogenase YagR molybdenum-binding subunit
VKRILLQWASSQLKVPVENLDVQDGMIVAPGRKMPFSELTQLRSEQSAVGIGRFELPNVHGKALQPFLAHFAEIEVNTGTGEIKVLRLLGAQDAGKVMNLMTYQNTLFGGMHFGMGFALYERRVMDQPTGKMLNANFHDYKIPTCMETPEMTCLPIDMHDVDSNIIGTKGLGEPVNFGFPGAIANAFYHATGVQCPAAPMTPARVLAALEKRQASGTRG